VSAVSLRAKEIVVGVSGGVAAYKAATIVSQLVQKDAQVTVVMTDAALRFIGTATFGALTNRPVCSDMFDSTYPLGPHIDLARRTDLLCVAPATANFLGKAAHGMADDMLSTLYLSFTKPVLFAPAMNCEMWDKPSVRRNVNQIVQDGVTLIGPEDGWLSCRQRGMGRMSNPETIVAAIEKALA
jgi:phosphopantothenoylcysteine decarboxylase/phosphopantothenate--cysteine ligase